MKLKPNPRLLLLPLLLSVSFVRGASAEPIGTQQQLTTFSPSSTSTYCGGPSLAHNAASRKTLAAYIENVAVSVSAPDGGMVRAAFMNGDAALSSTPIDISTTLPVKSFSNCDPPVVAAGPLGTWLVAWPPLGSGSSLGVNAQLLDVNGNLSGTNFTLSSNTNYGDIETVAIAWSPADSRYLVTWKANVSSAFPFAANIQQVVGRFLDASGSGIGNDFLVTNIADGVNNSQDVAFGGGRWIVVVGTNNNRRAVGQIVTTAGPQGSVFNLSTAGLNASNANIAPSIAYNSSTDQFAAVWKLRNAPYTEYARLLDSSGTPLGADVDLGGTGSRPRIASAGTYGYLVTWHNPGGSNLGPIYAVRLLSNGTVDGTPQEMTPGSPFQAWRPSVVFDQSVGKFLIAYAGNPNSSAPNNVTNYYARAWLTDAATSASEAITAPLAPQMLTINMTGSGAGVVTSSPSGVTCEGSCRYEFDFDSTVVLTAIPSLGSKFVEWGGACSGMTTCIVRMDVARSVTARFSVLEAAEPAAAVVTLPETL